MASSNPQSDPISFRLPIDLYQLLQHNATKYDRTVSQHVRQRLIESLELQASKSPPGMLEHLSDPANTGTFYVGDCGHPKARLINGGLKHCDECGATEGIDNLWRASA